MENPTITVTRTVSMGHRLPSYKGLCSSPHGHNMKVEVEVETLTPGRFLDFKDVDQELAFVIEPFDHAMVLYDDDVLLTMLNSMKFRTVSFPVEPTTEALAEHFFRLMDNSGYWKVLRVTVYETDKYSATVKGGRHD